MAPRTHGTRREALSGTVSACDSQPLTSNAAVEVPSRCSSPGGRGAREPGVTGPQRRARGWRDRRERRAPSSLSELPGRLSGRHNAASKDSTASRASDSTRSRASQASTSRR